MVTLCNQNIFTPTLNRLNNEWPAVWSAAIQEAPQQAGTTFGSCWTVCGSLGITDIQSNLSSLMIDKDLATVDFSTCGAEDVATLVVPLDRISVTIDVEGRATGNHTVWPAPQTVGTATHKFTATAALSGFVLVRVSALSGKWRFEEIESDIALFSHWMNPTWPDSNNILFDSVPFDDVLKEWNRVFLAHVRPKVNASLFKLLQSVNTLKLCSMPVAYAQSCTATTKFPSTFCHPCDTCCKCLMQQRCDGECSKCACVNCENTTWLVTSISFIFLLLTAIFAYFWFERMGIL